MSEREMVGDVSYENHGSICIVRPLTEVASEWIDEHVGGETNWWAGGLVVEPRYVDELLWGMESDGLVVS